MLHNEGIDVYGCDMSRDVIAFHEAEFGAHRFFHANEAGARRYDVVIATEVIEHLFDPIKEMAKVCSLYEPGGIFCGSTGFSIDGEVEDDGHGYMVSRGHVIYWSEKSLSAAFARLGWSLTTFRLASKVPTGRLFFGTANDDIRVSLSEVKKTYSERPLLQWSECR